MSGHQKKSNPRSQHGGNNNYQAPRRFAGQFVEIDPNAKLLGEKSIEGVSLVNDFEKTRSLQKRIGTLIGGPTDFFGGMWPVNLSSENVGRLKTEPYVVSVKPTGQRLLLYIDLRGDIYLENNSQHIFCTALKLFPLEGETILDGIMNLSSSGGKHTFFIQDAMWCNGTNLTSEGILKRLNFVKENLMKPRMEELKNTKQSDNNEAFNLDMVEIREFAQAKEFLDDEIENNFRYPVESLVFFPLLQGYKFEGVTTNHDIFQWRNNATYEGVFRLKISQNLSQRHNHQAELLVIGHAMRELVYDSISLTDEMRELDGKIISCIYKPIDNQWVYKKERKERQHPNSKKTVDGKLSTLQNPVTRQTLLECFETSRGRY